MDFDTDMNLNACTELRLGLPGTSSEHPKPSTSLRSINKRDFRSSFSDEEDEETAPPPSKAQIVGWPPVRAYRKNTLKKLDPTMTYVKVSMDGAPYLRKIDLKIYNSYQGLLKALEDMFKIGVGKYGSEYVPTYEDRDGDWMLVGDVPWNMFISSCKRLRIMKGSTEARGLITCL